MPITARIDLFWRFDGTMTSDLSFRAVGPSRACPSASGRPRWESGGPARHGRRHCLALSSRGRRVGATVTRKLRVRLTGRARPAGRRDLILVGLKR
jgi:hypothetical protein